MADEDQLSEEDRLAAMKLRVVQTLWQMGGTMRHDQYFMLPMELKWNHPAARSCIDEALRLVAEPHQTEADETDWSLRESARAWMNGEAFIPGPDDKVPVSRADYIGWVLFNADHGRFMPGECFRLWAQMLREVA